MPRTKALSLTAAAAAITLGLTACGGGAGSAGGEETLDFGYIFPKTGDLSHLGPPQISAAEFALQEINGAGGVLGKDVPKILEGDEANDAAKANEAANAHLDDGVDVLLGAAASGMTMAIIDKVTGAEIVQCSGSNTAPDLSTYEDGGYYYRTAPSDLLQGPVIAEEIAADGNTSVAITYRSDDYGSGLANSTAKALEKIGVEVKYKEGYDPNAANFDSVVKDIEAADADATVLVSFEEGVQIITGLLEAGVDADQMYATDGLNDQNLAEKVSEKDPGTIAGFKGSAPGVDNKEFRSNLTEFDKNLEVFQFAPQVYDCAIVSALAAEQAKSTDPTVFVKEMQAVSREGEKCSGFEECRDLIKDGTDIDYQGASGPIDFDKNGDVTKASFVVYTFDKNGKHKPADYVEASSDQQG